MHFLSKGGEAQVYTLEDTDRERLLYPHADIVRVETVFRELHAVELFYRYRIARELFPEHFPQVVGTRARRGDNLPIAEMYSIKAPVDDDHAVFSQDMDIHQTGKLSTCTCTACAKHREFHQSAALEEQARNVAGKLKKWGLHVPYDDPSDYCLTHSGDVLFFELDCFPGETQKALRESDMKDDRREFMYNLTKRLAYAKFGRPIRPTSHPQS